MREFMALLVVAFVALSVVADRGATPRVVTGTAAGFQAGEWRSVANEVTDPMGLQIALRETTAYRAIRPPARVRSRRGRPALACLRRCARLPDGARFVGP
jgi:hypothetical protein